MTRFFISALVGLLIYVQSGLYDLAYATRCSDVIPGQTFTYSDALTGFTAWNGKTYAIAKTVISGIMNNPDAFFAFAANPQQTRDDTTSLKAKVAAGYYGDARPVRIDSNVTRDVIRTQFGRFLESSPSSPRTTYVDAWKNYASVAFTHMDDTPLSWSDWVTNPPQGNYSAMAVVMTSDGKLAYGVDGARSAQIVEFDGELDCAQPFTAGAPIVGGTIPPDGTVNPPPDIEPETPNRDDPNAIQGVYCGGDTDGDGTVLGPGEIMNCLQSTNPTGGEFCPTAAVPCSVSGTSQDVVQQCAVGFWSTCNDPEIFISPNTSTWLPAECDGTGYPTWLSVDAQCSVVSAAAAGWAEATCVVNESRTAYTCTPHVAFSQPVVGHSVRAVTQTVPGVPSYNCPLGSQYACMADPTDSVMKCSPYACVNPDDEDGEEITDAPETIFTDDGARDADGTCLDQVMIFSGKSSRCRPPGLTVGYMNNCCESDSQASENMGNAAAGIGAIKVAQELYGVSQLAQGMHMALSNAAAWGTSAMQSSMAVNTVGSGLFSTTTVTITSLNSGTAAGNITLSGPAAQAAIAFSNAISGGASTISAIGSAAQAYATAFVTSPAFIIGIVMIVVMKVLMGNGCDGNDVTTAMMNKGGFCHYVGDYCFRKWPMVGCVQKAKGYCCFNSKLARILHEQGRPQLASFGPTGSWGVGSQPNCRGFYPEEFQALDFSKIDLSEYIGDIQGQIADTTSRLTDQITNDMTNYLNSSGIPTQGIVIPPARGAQ